MAVQSDTSRISYAGNNSTSTSYAVPFVFFENSHLKAIAKTSAGVESVVTLTNHTGAGNVNGGTVRTAVAVPVASTLTIYRDVPATQTTIYQEGGDFPAASHERALDKLTQISQQNARKLGSALRLSEANQIGELNPPLTNEQHILSSVGGAAPSWQALPSLSIGPVIATGSTTARSVQDRAADTVNVKDFGAVGDGAADDTAAIQAALNSTAKEVVFPSGTYRVQSASETSSTTALTSAVNDRIICGAGVITATTRVRKLLEVTGDRSRVSLNIDGNQKIGHAIDVLAEDCAVTDCHIYDLDGLTDWTATAISFSLQGLDTSGLVSGNIIKNLQAVGDGVSGNGVGMCRAIGIYSDQNCTKQVLVTGNVIDTVEGEEGDSIVVASGSTASPLTLPVTVSNNSVNLWTRRAVKIQASGVSVLNNTFSNDRVTAPVGLQRVVDITAGSNIVVHGNTFKHCKHGGQVSAFLDSPQTADNILVSANTVYGVGAETTASLFRFRTFGNNVYITGNTIICPNYAVVAVNITDATQVTVSGNIVQMDATGDWYSASDVAQTKVFANVSNANNDYQQYVDYNGGGENIVDLTEGGARSLTLINRDTAVSDGEQIAALSCRQNDTSYPNGLHASLRFVGEGSSGNTGVAIHTGTGVAPNTEKLTVRSNGNVGIGVTPTSKIHVDGDVTVSNATTATTAAGGARTLPANPVDFLVVSINGTSRKIPYYAT